MGCIPAETMNGVQMQAMVQGMEGKRLKYDDLTADNGLESGARAREGMLWSEIRSGVLRTWALLVKS